jgi:hypothetical protein
MSLKISFSFAWRDPEICPHRLKVNESELLPNLSDYWDSLSRIFNDREFSYTQHDVVVSFQDVNFSYTLADDLAYLLEHLCFGVPLDLAEYKQTAYASIKGQGGLTFERTNSIVNMSIVEMDSTIPLSQFPFPEFIVELFECGKRMFSFYEACWSLAGVKERPERLENKLKTVQELFVSRDWINDVASG